MSAEELIKPRYEVIADYPGSKFQIGSILEKTNKEFYYSDDKYDFSGIPAFEINAYPHLFRKLKWWEYRKKEDMPKRLASKFAGTKEVYEIEEWDMEHLIGWINVSTRSGCSLGVVEDLFEYFPID